MGSFDDALRQRTDAQQQRERQAQAASDAHQTRAATAVGAVKQLLKDCAGHLNNKIGPTEFELQGHSWLSPKKSPPGYLLYSHRREFDDKPSSLVVLTTDGQLWEYRAKSQYSKLLKDYTSVTAESLSAGVNLGSFAGHRRIVVSADGTPTVSWSGGYDDGTHSKSLHEWLADFAFGLLKKR